MSESVEAYEVIPEELSAALDAEARELLGISGEEFRDKWFAGEYRDDPRPAVTQVVMLMPDAWDTRSVSP